MEQAVLQGFAFGEHLEGLHQRSLGFRLLAPQENQPWCAEVEALARRLQAAPYPDHWPPTDLFCSLLLPEGRRLVGVVRYGLADHTPSQRRGGLELIGVVGPAGLDVPSALAVYRWLRQRRAEAKDLHALGAQVSLAEILAAVPPTPPATDPLPVLPIRLWQEGALLFAATAPSDPNHRLGLLEQGATANWQWLPLVGADFPLPTYAQRGPLVAWTPHLAGVAVKLDRKPDETAIFTGRRRSLLAATGAGVLLLLLVANLWATLSLAGRAGKATQHDSGTGANGPTAPAQPAAASSDMSAERFALGLQRLLRRQGHTPELSPTQVEEQYERLAAGNRDLRVATPEAREVVVAVNTLSRRSADRIEEVIRKALTNKGYDPKLIDLACRQVQEQLAAEGSGGR